MATRIYLVEFNKKTRMIDATSHWQAIKHCVSPNVNSRVATAKDVAVFVGDGGKIEDSVVQVAPTETATEATTETQAPA